MSTFGKFAAACAAVMGGVTSLYAVEQVSPGSGDDAATITAAIAAAAGEGGDGVAVASTLTRLAVRSTTALLRNAVRDTSGHMAWR